MDQFKDAQYFHIPSQGNIYTLTELKLSNGKVLVLAASLKRDIYYFEYVEDTQGLVLKTKEIPFTYIPSGAEIISIDAFNKSTVNNVVVIGITIIKNSNDSDTLETFLNIYSQLEEHEDFNIENIAQNCLTLELNFVPYKLMHTELVTWNENKIINKELVFILSGSDNLVHIYRENTSEHVYKEIERDHFPEFGKTPSPIVWIDICYINNHEERITAFGCECGLIKLLKVNTRTNKIVYNFSTRFTNYISKVHLYFENGTKHGMDKFGKTVYKPVSDRRDGRHILNLVVVNAVFPPVLFKDVLKYGFSDYISLPRHDNCNTFTSCIVADIDFDGKKEILIGSSSQEMILYKQDLKGGQWYLEEIRHIAAPILSIKYIDLSGDGVNELVISSMKGVHVLQHDSIFVQQKLSEKIDALTIPKITS